ncbi:glycosyltransferase family 39 protein [Nocardia miyunensis]|uniref:glycosyltransferase family 39 protein n=1 Tax=Nocardia miyunensis TaxID=282684 RepID=UPI0008323CAF|nr:glycosyltransferase family 39 protein [Nocardia miyunensis]
MTVIAVVRESGRQDSADAVSHGRRYRRYAAVTGLLIVTAVLYLWSLGAQGWANDFYAAAVQAGTRSAKAWLFGSLDAGNSITVDKPPAFLWVMVLSARVFGLNSWSMLVPQALMGVGSIGLLYATVRRYSGHIAGLLAGALLAVSPVAAVMFRYNHPDALMVLLLIAAAYCTLRAVESGSTRWVLLAGTAIGVAFLTKLLQAFLVIPAFGLVLLIAAPGSWWRRAGQVLAAAVAVVISGGWYVLLVSVWPASARPYIGGSSTNSLLELAFGYNGINRVVDGAGGTGGGAPGIGRLFGADLGTQGSWLLPAALIGLVAGLVLTARRPRTDLMRAGLFMWGGWLIVTGAVFSVMNGMIHPYYTVELAPAAAALIAVSATELWRRRAQWRGRGVLAALIGVTGLWAFALLDRTPHWLPVLRWLILLGSLSAAVLLVVGGKRLMLGAACVGLVSGVAGPVAYTLDTVATPHGQLAGPDVHGGGPDSAAPANNTALLTLLRSTHTRWAAAAVGSMTAGPLELAGNVSVMPIGGFIGGDPAPTLAQFQQYVAAREVRYFIAPVGGDRHEPAAGSPAAAITAWVTQHFTSMRVGGVTVYDLAA